MASQTDILKEYLLSLGFRVDEKSSRTFDTTTKKFDTRVKGLAKSTLAVGVAAQAMVLQFSRSMEQLYYKSRLAESTASNLSSLGYAGSQIGLGAEQMQSAVIRMASALRQNPGLIGLLHDLGVPVEGRDKADVFKDIVKTLKSMPFYLASQYGQLFGISPDELLLLEEGSEKLEKLQQQQRDMAASMGLNLEEATKAGTEYSQLFRELAEQGKILGRVVSLSLLPYFRDFAGVLKEVMKDWAKIVPKVVEDPKKFGDDLLVGLGLKSAGGGVKLTEDTQRRIALGALPAAAPANAASAATSNLPLGLRQNNPGNLRSWGSTPVLGGFANFGSAQEGLSAMAANLLVYQKRGWTSLNKIISHWAPASENKTDEYINAVSKSTGFGAEQLLDLSDPKVMSSLMAAMIKHEQGYNPFSQTDLLGAANSRLTAPVTIIQVHAPDPTSAGTAVARHQDQVNANLVRNVGTQVVR